MMKWGDDFEEAVRVMLIDYGALLVKEGVEGDIFDEYEMTGWKISGYTLGNFLDALGIQRGYPVQGRKPRPEDLDIEVERMTLRSTEAATMQALDYPLAIHARVRSPHLLDLRIRWRSFTQGITYCGNFAVDWAASPESEGSEEI